MYSIMFNENPIFFNTNEKLILRHTTIPPSWNLLKLGFHNASVDVVEAIVRKIEEKNIGSFKCLFR